MVTVNGPNNGRWHVIPAAQDDRDAALSQCHQYIVGIGKPMGVRDDGGDLIERYATNLVAVLRDGHKSTIK
jgi:hypothetical protein